MSTPGNTCRSCSRCASVSGNSLAAKLVTAAREKIATAHSRLMTYLRYCCCRACQGHTLLVFGTRLHTFCNVEGRPVLTGVCPCRVMSPFDWSAKWPWRCCQPWRKPLAPLQGASGHVGSVVQSALLCVECLAGNAGAGRTEQVEVRWYDLFRCFQGGSVFGRVGQRAHARARGAGVDRVDADARHVFQLVGEHLHHAFGGKLADRVGAPEGATLATDAR